MNPNDIKTAASTPEVKAPETKVPAAPVVKNLPEAERNKLAIDLKPGEVKNILPGEIGIKAGNKMRGKRYDAATKSLVDDIG